LPPALSQIPCPEAGFFNSLLVIRPTICSIYCDGRFSMSWQVIQMVMPKTFRCYTGPMAKYS
ncbi:hypothetical protein, partial [Haliea atlantica]